jgi:hypothetical protein
VTSQAKLAANRANGQKSRGPRSAAGKSSASRNAFRHGLAAITWTKPEIFPEIEPIARALCDEPDDPRLFEQALIIAEDEFVLRCVRVERIAAIERLRDRTAAPLGTGDLGLSRGKARFERAKLTYQMLVQRQNDSSNNNANPTTSSDLHRRWQERRERASAERAAREKLMQQRDEFDAMRLALPDLDRLERYERRAWSRQTRAIRRSIEIKSACLAEKGQSPQASADRY